MASLQPTEMATATLRIQDKCRSVCTCVLILIVALASGPLFANTIYGWIDRIEMQGTSAVIGGWTCQPSLNKSIDVFVYLGSAPPNGSLFRSTTANQALDPEVSAVCKTSGIAHRYTITLSSAEIMTHAGKAVYATGSSGAYSGALGNSGIFTVPEAPAPSVPVAPSVSVNNTSFNVSWSAVAFATRYQIRENQNNSGWQSPIDVGSNLSKSFSGVTGNSYQYQIMACNNKGCSGWSNTSNTAVARGIAGYLDSVTLNSDGSATLLGWGCDVMVSSPVTINLTVGSAGGTSLASGPTSVQAESAVNAICRTSGVAHRFQYRLTDSQLVQHKNKPLYATANGITLNGSGGVFIPALPAPGAPSTPAVSVTGKQLIANWGLVSYASYYNIEQNLNGTTWQGNTDIGNSNSYSFTGATGNSYQFRVQACNATGCSSWSAASVPAVALGLHGYLDKVVLNTDNSADILGWACDVKVNTPVYVDLNIGSVPTGSQSWKSVLTTVTAENDVNNICRTTGIAHRFIVRMSQAEVINEQNKLIFANGRNASGQTTSLMNSGTIKVPQPANSVTTEVPVILRQQAISSAEDSELQLKSTMFEISGKSASYTVIPKSGSNYSINGSSITPAKDFYGNLTIPVTVTDGVNTSAVFNAVINIINVNDPPYVIIPYTVKTQVNTAANFHITGLFTDKDGITLETKYLLVVNGVACAVECRTANGKITKNQADDWTSYDYLPDRRYAGVDHLVFYIMDPAGALSNVGRLFFEVSSGSSLSITSQKSFSFNEEQNFKFAPTDFTISGISSYTNVKIKPIQGDNYTVVDDVVTPAKDFFGLLNVKLYAQLNNQISDIYSAKVNIVNVDDAPVGRSAEVSYTSGADRNVDNINIADFFLDPDVAGGLITNMAYTVQFVNKTNSTSGVTPNGRLLKKNPSIANIWIFQPNPQFVGKETVDVWLTDNTGRQSLTPVRLYFNINAAGIISPVRFTPDGGSFSQGVAVSLASETTGSQIRFTTDGSDVTSNSALYTAPISLSASTTVKARAFKTGMTDSVQSSASFVIGSTGPVEYIYDSNGRLLRTENK